MVDMRIKLMSGLMGQRFVNLNHFTVLKDHVLNDYIFCQSFVSCTNYVGSSVEGGCEDLN